MYLMLDADEFFTRFRLLSEAERLSEIPEVAVCGECYVWAAPNGVTYCVQSDLVTGPEDLDECNWEYSVDSESRVTLDRSGEFVAGEIHLLESGELLLI